MNSGVREKPSVYHSPAREQITRSGGESLVPLRLLAHAPEAMRAIARLAAAGVTSGARSRKLSVRVDPGAMDAAGENLGLTNPSDVVNAALALAAAPDRFKVWWMETRDTLPDDFDLAV